jgi:lambda repressor-like predicted transcriptional regulator
MTLLEIAKAQGWTVAALAEELGVSRSMLSQALHGRTCSRGYWFAVGQVLGLSSKELADCLYGNERVTSGGGTLAGSIRART